MEALSVKFTDKFKFLLILGFLFFIAPEAKAQWTILEKNADSLIKVGSDYIYNAQFDNASECFKKIINEYPNYPAGYFLDAMVEWWKITLFRTTTKYDKVFLKKIDRVIDICDRILDTNAYDIGALFFKGGALGFKGRYHSIRKNWFSAAIDGQNAYRIFLKCQELAPNNSDIMLGTGLFNYFTDAIPEEYPTLKPLLAFLPQGNKVLGIMQLRAAAQTARYASTEAKVVLLQIYYSFEKDFYKALKISEELFKEYPNNPYFQRYLGRCYVTTGNLDKWEKTWRDVLLNYIHKKPGYDVMTAREALYYIGSALMQRQDYKMAVKYLKKCDEACDALDEETVSFKVQTNLKLGKIYDRQGNRKEAVRQYKLVLKMDEYDNSHKYAERYLKTPYK